MQARLPANVLVLPAHGKPFRGAHARLKALVDEHLQGLASLEALCREPRRAVVTFPALFRSPIDDKNLTMTNGSAPSHTRILSSVLSGVERRTLAWLAARMPAWVHSDHLTALALVAMLGAGLSYVLSTVTPVGFGLVGVCLAINWFGDSLDGTLARVRRQERPRYGYYVDHIVDAFGIVFVVGGMAAAGVMSPVVALGFLVAYFMLSIEVYLATYSLGEFRLT
jgi:hypothetical protein